MTLTGSVYWNLQQISVIKRHWTANLFSCWCGKQNKISQRCQGLHRNQKVRCGSMSAFSFHWTTLTSLSPFRFFKCLTKAWYLAIQFNKTLTKLTMRHLEWVIREKRFEHNLVLPYEHQIHGLETILGPILIVVPITSLSSVDDISWCETRCDSCIICTVQKSQAWNMLKLHPTSTKLLDWINLNQVEFVKQTESNEKWFL